MLLGIKLSNLTRYQKILKAKNIFFTQFCRVPKLQHSAKENLPSVKWRHLANYPLCRVPGGGTRQRLDAISPLTGGARRACVLGTCAGFAECRRASTRQRGQFAECHSLPTAGTRQSSSMPCGKCLPSARGLALGKPHLCRVPVFWHSVKAETLGKFGFSGSDLPCLWYSKMVLAKHVQD